MNFRSALVRASSAAALFAIVAPTAARAQFAIDKTEMFLRPDVANQRSGVLMVRNEGTVRAQAVIKLEDWDRSEDGTNRFFPANTKAGSCASAMKVFPLSVSLEPNEAQAIRIDLDATKSAEITKECWSIVLVEASTPQKQADGRTLLYTLRTGMKVYAAPAGLKTEGEVSDVVLAPRTNGGSTEYDATVTFKNSGEKHLTARGRLEVRREDNSLVTTVALPNVYALPGAEMKVKAALPTMIKGKYMVLAILDYGGAELAAAQLEHEAR